MLFLKKKSPNRKKNPEINGSVLFSFFPPLPWVKSYGHSNTFTRKRRRRRRTQQWVRGEKFFCFYAPPPQESEQADPSLSSSHAGMSSSESLISWPRETNWGGGGGGEADKWGQIWRLNCPSLESRDAAAVGEIGGGGGGEALPYVFLPPLRLGGGTIKFQHLAMAHLT